MGSGKSKSVTVGYHYYMNVHFAIAHGGVDELHEIRIGERVAWRGNLTSSSSAIINKPELFGGEKKEGGVIGTVDLMSGESNQPINPSLQSAIARATGSSDIPAYRGVSTLFFKGADGVNMNGTPWASLLDQMAYWQEIGGFIGRLLSRIILARSSFLWGAMNPYFKTPAFLVRRIWKDWYPAKAKIGENANPIHIIYETLTNKVWGLGYPSQDIDDSSFRAAADVMFNEGFGLSMRWSNQSTIEEFIKMVNEHINATLVEDRATGRWRMIMVRDNYNIDNLFELNESNCVVEEFQRKTMGETINEVVVAYTRPEDGETDTVTVQNLANFANTGQINSQKKEYPGIADADTAFRIAMRDLNTLSKPIAKVTVTCDQSIMGQYPGDVIKLNWPRLGLNGIPVRIGKMNLGNLTQGEIQIEAVEDVFALPDNTYIERQPIGWVDSQRQAEPVTDQKLFELTYYELHTSTDSADRLDWPEDIGFVATASLSPNSDSNSLALYDNVGQKEVANGDFTTLMLLSEPTGYIDTVLTLDLTGIDVTVLLGGGLAYLGDELIQITNYNITTGKVTVKRGLIDTVPAKHPVGEKVWFYAANDYVLDTTDRVAGEVVSYKLLPETSIDKLELNQAPLVSYTLQNRQMRPYRPGNLKTNGVYYPEFIDGSELSVSWAHRDRTQEVAPDPTVFTAGNIGPEPGVTYNLVIKGETGTVLKEEMGLVGTQYLYATEAQDLNTYELAPSGIFVYTDGSSLTLTISLGTWTTDTSLPDVLAYSQAIVTSNRVYLLGGRNGGGYVSTVYTAPINADGTLGTWTTDTSLPDVLAYSQAIVTSNRVYLLGGRNGGGYVSTVYTAPINADGTLGTWTTDTSLPDVLASSQAIVTSNRVYLLGGRNGGGYVSTVYTAPINADGTLGTWTTDTSLPDALAYSQAIVTSNRVYLLGGRNGGGYVSTVYTAPINADGTLVTPQLRLNANLEIELKSVRDGLESYQSHNVELIRVGYGYNYGAT